jgi:hypothetical protein
MSRMNWTHSGILFTAAGFLWLIAVVIVLVTNAPLNLGAAGMIAVLPVVLCGEIRPHRREPRSRH